MDTDNHGGDAFWLVWDERELRQVALNERVVSAWPRLAEAVPERRTKRSVTLLDPGSTDDWALV